MSAQSPRRGTRAFTVLLAVLLVGGLVAPIAASQPAAAQSDDTAEDVACYSISSMAGPSGYLINEACQDWTTETTSYDGSAAATQTTLHGMAVSEWESEKALRTIMSNYATDTQTLASLEARNAIATAYEQGNTSSEADQMAQDAIQAYYAQRQINALETWEKTQAQHAHIGNISNEDAIHDKINHIVITGGYESVNDIDSHDEQGDSVTTNGMTFTGDMRTHTYTLANGTDYQYQSAEIHIDSADFEDGSTTTGVSGGYDFSVRPDLSYKGDTNDLIIPSSDISGSSYWDFYYSGEYYVKNSYVGTSNDPANGLPAQMVHDTAAWKENLEKFDTQSQQMITEYQGIASDLYDEMDAGRLDPNQLRGAEGMVRYLSGGSDASEGDLRTALHYTLGTQNPNLTETSKMRVHIDGYTDVTYNTSTNTDASREPVPSDPMNDTVEGLLFADGVSSVSAGDTFSTNVTDGKSFTIIREDGSEIALTEGNMTVEAIYDSDGNEVENATYEDPKYDSYNAEEFVQYLEENEEARAAIVSDDDDSGGIGLPSLSGLPDAGGALVGIAIIGVVAFVVIGFVTDLIPGVGK